MPGKQIIFSDLLSDILLRLLMQCQPGQVQINALHFLPLYITANIWFDASVFAQPALLKINHVYRQMDV